MSKRRRQGSYPPRGGKNPALTALQHRANDHRAQVSEDLKRFKAIRELESSSAPLDWLLAETAYRKLLDRPELHPDLSVECLIGLLRARVMLRNGFPERYRLEEGVEIVQRLIGLRGTADSHYRLAVIQLELGNLDDAMSAAEQAVTLEPTHLPAWEVIARCHRALGATCLALQTYNHLIRLPVWDARYISTRGRALLMTGNYSEGYRDYNTLCAPGEPELGFSGPEMRRLLLSHMPMWRGEPLPDRRLLLLLDGGYGDAIQMARWIPQVRARVGSLRIAVNKKLWGLFGEQGWEVELVTRQDFGTGYDRWLNADGLPGACGCASPSDLPQAPYLRTGRVRPPLPGVFRVGIVWAGQPGHPEDKLRSAALADWAQVLAVPGVQFYSLQLGTPAEQVEDFAGRVSDLSGELLDWRDTAAVLHQLDLLISVDSAVASLAGALGLPVWVCLYPVSDWRWPLEGATTPWYATARLLRQPKVGDWGGVFARVAEALECLDRDKAENRSSWRPGCRERSAVELECDENSPF